MRYLLILVGLMVGTANAETTEKVYFCIDEAVGGVSYSDNQWVGGEFPKTRFSLKAEMVSGNLVDLTIKDNVYVCKTLITSLLTLGKQGEKISSVRNCVDSTYGHSILFDTLTKRYVYSDVNVHSYIDSKVTPVVRVGTCETF